MASTVIPFVFDFEELILSFKFLLSEVKIGKIELNIGMNNPRSNASKVEPADGTGDK
jgi:hypothetical protein